MVKHRNSSEHVYDIYNGLVNRVVSEKKLTKKQLDFVKYTNFKERYVMGSPTDALKPEFHVCRCTDDDEDEYFDYEKDCFYITTEVDYGNWVREEDPPQELEIKDNFIFTPHLVKYATEKEKEGIVAHLNRMRRHINFSRSDTFAYYDKYVLLVRYESTLHPVVRLANQLKSYADLYKINKVYRPIDGNYIYDQNEHPWEKLDEDIYFREAYEAYSTKKIYKFEVEGVPFCYELTKNGLKQVGINR